MGTLSKRKFLASAGAGMAGLAVSTGSAAQPAERWDREFDLVIVGAGIGGLSAAITAHDAGLKPLIIEKMAKVGGVTSYSHGIVWVAGNFLQKAAGLDDDVERGERYIEFLGAGFGDPKKRTRLMQMAPVVLDYMVQKAGLRFKIVPHEPDYYFPLHPAAVSRGRYLEVEPFDARELGEWSERTIPVSPHFAAGITVAEYFGEPEERDTAVIQARAAKGLRTLGPGLIAYLAKAALVDRKIPVLLGTRVHSLVRAPGGPVRGVTTAAAGGAAALRIGARRGVVIAAGGYDWNENLTRSFEQIADLGRASPPSVEGDGLIMAAEVSAAIAAVPPFNLGNLIGRKVPDRQNEGREFWTFGGAGGPHAILVNRDGARFCDETYHRDSQPRAHEWDGLKQRYRNLPAFAITDQSGTATSPSQPVRPGMVRADTLEQLARELGVDPAGLAKTVARFNGFCRDGVDPDFQRDDVLRARAAADPRHKFSSSMAPLEKPPYYGQQLTLMLSGVNAAGLQTDFNAQVLDVRGVPIPALYAIGNAAAWTDVGAGGQSGLPNTRGMTWGFIAARHAAGSNIT